MKTKSVFVVLDFSKIYIEMSKQEIKLSTGLYGR